MGNGSGNGVGISVIWDARGRIGCWIVLEQVQVLELLRLLRTGDALDRMEDVCRMVEEMLRVPFNIVVRDMIKKYIKIYGNIHPNT